MNKDTVTIAFGRLPGSASQNCTASFLYSSGAAAGIVSQNPDILLYIELLSLNGNSPVAIKYIIIPKE